MKDDHLDAGNVERRATFRTDVGILPRIRETKEASSRCPYCWPESGKAEKTY